MRFTTSQLAEYFQMDRENAYTLIRFLEAEGIIQRDGAEEPTEKRRGKRQYAYKFSNDTIVALQKLIATK
jgi:predicted transcriptional regulator